MFRKMFKKNCRYIDDISQNEIINIIKNNEDVILLDVRSRQEYNEGHLRGAINIPVYELQYRSKNELKNKNSIIIAYCSAGIRSRKAVNILKRLGYKNLYNVEGGIIV